MSASGRARHLVWIVLDGCHAGVFHKLFHGGKLPNLQRIFQNGAHVNGAVTCFPSVTVACLASLFTGCEFKTHGILGNVWYDRSLEPISGRAYTSTLGRIIESYGRRYLGFPKPIVAECRNTGRLNDDLNPKSPTIFEVFRNNGLSSCSMYNFVGRGATYWFRPTHKDMLAYLNADREIQDASVFDKLMVKRAIQYLNRAGMPNLMALYFGGNDSNSHRYGVEAQADYLQSVVEPLFGDFLEAVSKNTRLEDVVFALVADHGQTEFPKPGDGHKKIWREQIQAALEATGLKIDGGENPDVDPAADVIFAMGTGGSFSLYVKNRETGRWADPPRFAQDIAPVADFILKSSAFEFSGVAEPAARWLSFLLIRETPDTHYMVYSNGPAGARTIPLEEFFADKKGRYPAAISQIRGIEHPARGPDIIAVLDYDLGGYYVAGREHRGNHGHLCADDTYIPMMFAGPGVARKELTGGRLIDVAPTVAAAFGLEMPSADGSALDVFG